MVVSGVFCSPPKFVFCSPPKFVCAHIHVKTRIFYKTDAHTYLLNDPDVSLSGNNLVAW